MIHFEAVNTKACCRILVPACGQVDHLRLKSSAWSKGR